MQTSWRYNQYFYTTFPFPSVYIKSGRIVQEDIQIVHYTLHEKKPLFLFVIEFHYTYS